MIFLIILILNGLGKVTVGLFKLTFFPIVLVIVGMYYLASFVVTVIGSIIGLVLLVTGFKQVNSKQIKKV